MDEMYGRVTVDGRVVLAHRDVDSSTWYRITLMRQPHVTKWIKAGRVVAATFTEQADLANDFAE